MTHTAPPSFQLDAATESYEDVKKLLYKLAHRFAARYQVPFEDTLSEAHRCFMIAFAHYRPAKFSKKASFPTYVYWVVSHQLTTYLLRQQRHNGHLEINEEVCGTESADSFRLGLESELEEDAKVVVSLLLDAPGDFADILRGSRTPHQVRRTLHRYLEDVLGWNRTRVAIAFDELRALLT